MHPKEFMERWLLSPGEMAELLGVHPNSIYNWTAPNATKHPGEETLARLYLIHVRWLEWELQDNHLPKQMRLLYEIARDRRLKQQAESATDADI